MKELRIEKLVISLSQVLAENAQCSFSEQTSPLVNLEIV